MVKKLVIAGGSGFIGRFLTEQFSILGYQVIIISRQSKELNWNNQRGIIDALEDADLLINLAGKSVDCSYSEKNKAEILKSRTATTRLLGEAILSCRNPPKLWINSSTATIYRHAEDRPMTESTGEIGSGFSVDVARGWENSFFAFHFEKTRQIALRMAIVLGSTGGVIKPLAKLVRFGLGGKQGNGKQMFSWLHIEDLMGIILFLQSSQELTGVFNCSTPNPIDNQTLMKSLRQKMGVPIGLPSPVWLLNAGALMIRTEPELILKSRWVIPERLLQLGYKFKYPKIEEALRQILD